MMPWIRLLRPKHWLKNLMLLFPPFFGGELIFPGIFFHAFWPLAAFSLGASGMYIFNDIADIDRDALHPQKKNRPLPSGAIKTPQAYALGATCLLLSLWLAANVSFSFLLYLLAYQILIIGYSLWLKQVAVLDIFCVSIGFLLRLEAGGVAFTTAVSEWLFLTVFLLALFLATGKRLAEKKGLQKNNYKHRPVLEMYRAGFLEGVMFMTGSAVLVTYSIYVLERPRLIYTVPLCCLGLFRYMHRIWQGYSGEPVKILFKDPVICIIAILWLFYLMLSIYLH